MIEKNNNKQNTHKFTHLNENKLNKFRKNICLYFKDAKWSIFIVLVWFAIGFIYFSIKAPGNIAYILLNTFYLMDPTDSDIFAAFYTLIGTIIISQGVFAIIISRMLEKTNPKITCREIAKDINEPIIVIHYGHIGSRIADYYKQKGKKCIIIEQEEDLVRELLEDGEPVIVGDPISENVLDEIDLKNAKAVFICTNNLQHSLVLSNKIRKINDKCKMVVRIFEDKLQSILEAPPYNAICFSTSKTAIKNMRDSWVYNHQGKAIVIGVSNFTIRLVKELKKANREAVVIDEDEDKVDYFKGTGTKALEADANQMDFLESTDVDIKSASQIFIDMKEQISDSIAISANIKKKYPDLKVYVRLFDDDLAEFLERLDIETFSTSKFTFKLLKSRILEKIE